MPALVGRAIVSLLETVDYSKLTVSAVVERAQIARSSFYRYYESVEDALRSLEDGFFDQIRRVNSISLQVPRGADDARHPSESIISRLEFLHENRDFLLAVDGPHGDPSFHARAERIFDDYFQRRFAEANLGKAESELCTAFLSAGHYNLVRLWLEKYPEIPASRIGEITNRQFYAYYLD